MRSSTAKPIIASFVQQHVEEAIALRISRTRAVREAHGGLQALVDLDERLQAHLDALAVAGDAAWPLCQSALEDVSTGSLFVAAVHAIRHKRLDRLEQLIALAEAVPHAMGGLTSAFGWLESSQLRNIVATLLQATDMTARMVGISACSLHRVDPGLSSLLEDPHPMLRALALRTAGDLGLSEWLPVCIDAIDDEDPACQLWAARSAVLLGDRHHVLDWLADAMSRAPRESLLDLVLGAMPMHAGHELLRTLAANPANAGWQLRGAGVVAGAGYLPWLLRRMQEPSAARRAAEAFALITGVDLIDLNLEGRPPVDFESGPSDDPALADVAMDADDHLPWPDTQRIERWWEQNSARFAAGQRYFAGAPATREHCIEVLKTGCARQRRLAAYHLCLLAPGTALFEWRAPAWRQVRALSS